MFVSWRCITYQREEYIPSIVNDFLEQDYKGKKEFVILNDDPDVHYVCDHPEVRIFNWEKRFGNVRDKANKCVDLCRGEILIPTADDDKWESHATTRFVKEIGSCPFVAAKGFYKAVKLTKKSIEKRTWYPLTIGGLYACRIDFYKRMGGQAKYMRRYNKAKGTCSWVLHPEDFMERVREAKCYKEFSLNKNDYFFTWRRYADHANWGTQDREKFIVKDRTPRVVKIG